MTAWTNSVPRSYDLGLEDILDSKKLALLENAFHRPEQLRSGGSRADLTKTAADKFSTIALSLSRGNAPQAVAHFVNRLAFLFFAEDVRLLPDGYFRRVLREMAGKPKESQDLLGALFAVLKKGGRFGVDRLPQVNGGLFDDEPALELSEGDIALLVAAGSENWAHIDPSIFGTLFERLLDPDKRSQIGAHYTDSEKIMRIVEPVIVQPLREEWQVVRAEINSLTTKARQKGVRAKEWQRAEEKRSIFLERLRGLSILDPACGSGNFLYLALHAVKDLEHATNQECEVLGLPPRMPIIGPEILRGIEINPLAAELARTTIWIGDIQWAIQNGIYSRPEPILRQLDTIECRDALVTDDGQETAWPEAEFIIGNPPFLGVKKMIGSLGAEYVRTLRKLYAGRVSPFSDLVCWWFAKSSEAVKNNKSRRVGLVATNSIRGGKNRLVLDQIASEFAIHDAWGEQRWVNDGAAVKVSIVCFSSDTARERFLDGSPVAYVNADLTRAEGVGGFDLTRARRLRENAGSSFVGTVKAGPFDIAGAVARAWLKEPLNPNGRPNSDVLRPWYNTIDIVRRERDSWVVDFQEGLSEREAALYQSPFKHVMQHVKPLRMQVRRPRYRDLWWQFAEPCMGMRRAISHVPRYIATPTVSKHRIFVFVDSRIQPDHQLVAIGRDDYTTFGILHSRFHEAWALRLGTSLEDRPRYTPTTTFETYPFPPGMSPDIRPSGYGNNALAQRIADAAKRIDDLRSNWLYPPDLVRIEHESVSGFPDRVVSANVDAAVVLRQPTLTKLYNERPPWLDDAHSDLDRAVAAAYGWPETISLEDALSALLRLNIERAANNPSKPATQDAGAPHLSP